MDLFDLDANLQQYIEANISPEDPVLNELSRYTFLKVSHPRMISGPVQGKFLEFIAKMMRPERILEIGTFTGYSAICLARGLAPGGKMISLEVNDELKAGAEDFFKKAGLTNKIEILNGDALEIIPGLNEEFDLVFIDGEKEEYIRYYELSLAKLKPGGYILADNVLWDGKVLEPEEKQDGATRAIDEFNRFVQQDDRVENMILPLRDGVSVIRKITEA